MLDMNRRSMLGRALLLVGAAVGPGSVEALAAAANAARPQLDAARFATLAALADTIVPRTETPGAVEVGVPKMVDALLVSWASPDRRGEILGSLDRLDAAAKEQKGKAFATLTPADRLAVLRPVDAAALKTVEPAKTPSPTTVPVGKATTTIDPQVGRAKQQPAQTPMEAMTPAVADPGYGKLKELIVIGYYSTEAALTTELRYEHDPGAWVPSLPVTPETRPWGGYALI